MHAQNLSISVIVPVYNGGNDFRRCLKSLVASVQSDVRCSSGYEGIKHEGMRYEGLKHQGLKYQGVERRSAPNLLGKRNYATAWPDDRRASATVASIRNDTLAGVENVTRRDVERRDIERPRVVEIIVVSDGDSDGSWRLAELFGVRLIRLPESGGPAKARNIGAKSATGDILLFIDADVEVHLDTLEKVGESFENNAELDALIGSYDDAPGAPNFLSQYRNLIHHYTHQEAPLEASTFWGACGAIRRHVFEEMGGFDENYRRPCIEDIELGYRLKYAGHHIHLRPDIQVKHLKRWTPTSLLRADIFYRALPWSDLLMQIQQTRPAFYRRFTQELNLKWSSKVSVVLVFGLVFSGVGAILMSASPAVAWMSWRLCAWLIALLCGVGLIAINLPIYRFFSQKHGWLFALKTIPWHWLYFFYSGLVYAYSAARYRLRPG